MAGALGNLLIVMTADTAQARQDIGKAAHQVERDMAEMQRNATAAGVLIAEAIGQVAGAFSRAAKDALEFGDTLNKVSQRTNFNVERLSEMAFAAELADVSVNQLGTGLSRFNKVLADADKEGSKAANIFKALGVEITQGPQAAFEQFAKAINILPTGEDKVATMRAVFGQAGDALLPMIAGLDDATEKARKLGLTMSQQLAQDAERFNDSVTVLGTSTRALALTAMQPLSRWLAEVSENMVAARLNGNALSVTFMEMGKTWSLFFSDFARTFGLTRVADAMESEFNRLDKRVRELTARTGDRGQAVIAPTVDQEALSRAVAGVRDPKMKKVRSVRDDNLLGRQLQEDQDEWAKIMSEAAAATDKYNQKVREREAAEVQAEISAQIARAESIVQMDEILAQQTRMANGWDENGRKIAESTKKANDMGRELGFTFSSAFEDAVIAGKKFSEVLQSLAQDIARIVLRKTVTEPLGAAISKGLGKALEGVIPSFDVGTPFVQRDTLAFVHQGEAIIPAAQNRAGGGYGSGVSVVNHYQIDSRTDRSHIIQLIEMGGERTKSQIMNSLNRGGEFAVATGRA